MKNNNNGLLIGGGVLILLIVLSQSGGDSGEGNVINNFFTSDDTSDAPTTNADIPAQAQAPASAPVEVCVDSDGGQDIIAEGQIDGFFYMANGDKLDYTYFDACEAGSDRLLIEMSCENNLPKVNSIDCADNQRLCDNGGCVFPASIDEACQMKFGDIWSPISEIKGFASDEATCDALTPGIVARAEWTAVYEFGEVCCHIGDA